MVFTKREKVILAATIAVLCLLVLDVYVLTPLLAERDAVEARKQRLLARFARATSLLRRRRMLERRWHGMLTGGMKRDPAEAESQLLRSLRDWSADTGVSLSSLRPERSAEELTLPEVTVHAAGTGSMAAVSRLLWRAETSKIPVRIKMLQLGSRKDGTDDLSLHLRVSTLYSPAGQAAPQQPAKSARRTRGDR